MNSNRTDINKPSKTGAKLVATPASGSNAAQDEASEHLNPMQEKDYGSIFTRLKSRCFGKKNGGDKTPSSNPYIKGMVKIGGGLCTTALAIFGELTALVLGAGILWFGFLTSVMAQGEADVTFLKRNFSIWFAQAYDGQDADISTFKIQWHPGRESIGFLAKDIIVKDDKGEPLLTVKSIYTESPVTALLRRGFEAHRLDLEGGQFTLRRDDDGAIVGAIGGPDVFGRLGPVIQVAGGGEKRAESGGFIDTVSLKDTVVFLRDDFLGVSLDLKDVNFQTDVSDEEILARGSAELILTETSGDSDAVVPRPHLNVNVKRERFGEKALDIDVAIDRFNPSELNFKTGVFSQLKQIDMLLNLSLQWKEVGRAERKAKFDVHKADESSRSNILGLGRVDGFSVSGVLDEANDTLSFDEFNLRTRDIRLNANAETSGLIAQLKGGEAAVGFDIKLNQLDWAAETLLTRPIEIKAGHVKGSYKAQGGQLSVSDMRLPISDYIFKSKGEVGHLFDSEVPISAKIQGEFEGDLSEVDLLSLWPKNAILAGRNWIKSSIVSGTLFGITLDVDIPDFSQLESGGLPDDAVQVDFNLRDGLVQYIRTMTPLDDARGFGRLRANGIELTLTGGRVGEMLIDNGRVNIPQFFPYGNDFTIEFDGHGPVDYLVELIDQKPFEYASLYDLSPKDFSGEARAKFKVTRPLREIFPSDNIAYEVEVLGTNVDAPFGFGDYVLTNGTLFLTADKTGMTIKGPAQIGPLSTEINWRETFDFGATPTALSLVSRVDNAALDKFGVSLREYFGGDIPFTLDAEGAGVDFDTARISANLRDSEWVIGDFWSKAIGVDGTASLSVSRNAAGQIVVDNFQAKAPGLGLSGVLRLDNNMRLLEAGLEQFFVEGFVDANLSVLRSSIDEPLQATLTGDYLNLNGFIGPALWQSGSGGGEQFPLSLKANLNSLTLAPNYKINKVDLVYNHSGEAINEFRFSGGSSAGPVQLSLQTLDEGPFASRLNVDVANASDVANAFFSLDNISGGRLYGEAVRPRGGNDLIWSGTLNIDDVTLVNAPFLAQMLSLASFDGLGDVLNGDGVNFENIEIPFTWGEGIVGLEGARAAGPALGLTADGDIDVANKRIDLDGTLIPAYSANAFLGSIPIIGDIFGGDSDNATLGLTYAVKGTFGQAQVGINPLSALTPGILRQIFKPSREKRRVEIPSDNQPKPKSDIVDIPTP